MANEDGLDIPPHLRVAPPPPPAPVAPIAQVAPPPPPPPSAAAQEAPAAGPPQIDVGLRTGQYVKLRDKIKEIGEKHALELKPLLEAKAMLDALLLDHLHKNNTKSMRTDAGTISSLDKVSVSVEDGDTFREFVTTNQDWDLVDFRANAPAVQAYLEENKELPPGVKMSAFRTLGVRRS